MHPGLVFALCRRNIPRPYSRLSGIQVDQVFLIRLCTFGTFLVERVLFEPFHAAWRVFMRFNYIYLHIRRIFILFICARSIGLKQFLTKQGGIHVPSITPLPLSDLDLRRAAEEMIAEHGDVALTQAEERVRALTAEGFDSIAKTWERIAGAIREMQRTKTRQADGYRRALERGVTLSE